MQDYLNTLFAKVPVGLFYPLVFEGRPCSYSFRRARAGQRQVGPVLGTTPGNWFHNQLLPVRRQNETAAATPRSAAAILFAPGMA